MHSSIATEIDPAIGLGLALSRLLARIITLQLRTKGCHWHVNGAQFRSLHALFDEQAGELSDLADEVAERCRALEFSTIACLADVAHFHPAAGERATLDGPDGMLTELRLANLRLREEIKSVRRLADEQNDIVGVSLADGWLAATERRVWMLTASLSGDAR